MIRRLTLAVFTTVLLVALTVTPASAYSHDWSGAKDPTVQTDISGWMKVSLRYENRGYLGNVIKRVCVKAKPNLTKSVDFDVYLGDRWSAGTIRLDMGRYHGLADGSRVCKKTSARQRQYVVDDAWRWKGWAWGPYCIGDLCPFMGAAAAKGSM